MSDETKNGLEELEVMKACAGALDRIEDDRTLGRILTWLNHRYYKTDTYQDGSEIADGSEREVHDKLGSQHSDDIASYFNRAHVTTNAERALVVAAWLREHEGIERFEGYAVNKLLKNLGYGVANITRTLEPLMKCSPKLVIQVAKSGRARQSRKRYMVTDAGLKRVNELMEPEAPSDHD